MTLLNPSYPNSAQETVDFYNNIAAGSDSAVIQAVFTDDVESLEKAVTELDTDLFKDSDEAKLAIHLACVKGQEDTIKKLYDINPKLLTLTDDDKRNCLHLAVISGNLDLVKFICDLDSESICAVTQNGSTALHLAVEQGFFDIVQFLCGSGHILINAEREDEASPVDLAIHHKHELIAVYLSDLLIEECKATLNELKISLNNQVNQRNSFFVSKMLLKELRALHNRFESSFKIISTTIESDSPPLEKAKTINDFCNTFKTTQKEIGEQLVSYIKNKDNRRGTQKRSRKVSKQKKVKSSNRREMMQKATQTHLKEIEFEDLSNTIEANIESILSSINADGSYTITVRPPKNSKWLVKKFANEEIEYPVTIQGIHLLALQKTLQDVYKLRSEFNDLGQLRFKLSEKTLSNIEPSQNFCQIFVASQKELVTQTKLQKADSDFLQKNINQFKEAVEAMASLEGFRIEKIDSVTGQIQISHSNVDPLAIKITYPSGAKWSGTLSQAKLTQSVLENVHKLADERGVSQDTHFEAVSYRLNLPKGNIRWNIKDWKKGFYKTIRKQSESEQAKSTHKQHKQKTDQSSFSQRVDTQKAKKEKLKSVKKQSFLSSKHKLAQTHPNVPKTPETPPKEEIKPSDFKLISINPDSLINQHEPRQVTETIEKHEKLVPYRKKYHDIDKQTAPAKRKKRKARKPSRINKEERRFNSAKKNLLTKMPVYFDSEYFSDNQLAKLTTQHIQWAYLINFIRICELDYQAAKFDSLNRIFENEKEAKNLRQIIHHPGILKDQDNPSLLLKRALGEMLHEEKKNKKQPGKPSYRFPHKLCVSVKKNLSCLKQLIADAEDQEDKHVLLDISEVRQILIQQIDEINDASAIIKALVSEIEMIHQKQASKVRQLPPVNQPDFLQNYPVVLDILAMQIMRVGESYARILDWTDRKKILKLDELIDFHGSGLPESELREKFYFSKDIRNFLAHDNKYDADEGKAQSFFLVAGKMDIKIIFDAAMSIADIKLNKAYTGRKIAANEEKTTHKDKTSFEHFQTYPPVAETQASWPSQSSLSEEYSQWHPNAVTFYGYHPMALNHDTHPSCYPPPLSRDDKEVEHSAMVKKTTQSTLKGDANRFFKLSSSRPMSTDAKEFKPRGNNL